MAKRKDKGGLATTPVPQPHQESATKAASSSIAPPLQISIEEEGKNLPDPMPTLTRLRQLWNQGKINAYKEETPAKS